MAVPLQKALPASLSTQKRISAMSGNCSSGCQTRDHRTYGECMRAKAVRPVALGSIHGEGFSLDRQKAWDKELSEYRDARRQGIQPATTNLKDIRKAVDISNATGRAFDAGA